MMLGRGESGQIYGAETGGGGKDGKMGTRKEKKKEKTKTKARNGKKGTKKQTFWQQQQNETVRESQCKEGGGRKRQMASMTRMRKKTACSSVRRHEIKADR